MTSEKRIHSPRFIRLLSGIRNELQANGALLALLIVPVLLVVVFSYLPMYGVFIAFEKNYQPLRGFFASGFAGLENFRKLFEYHHFRRILTNTLVLNVYDLMLLPVPMLFALVLKHCPLIRLKRVLSSAALLPMHLSTIVVCGMVQRFLSTEGLVNQVLAVFGVEPQNHLLNGPLFPHLYVLSGLWQSMGYSSLLYSAILTDSSDLLHEAAQIDGASLFQRMIRIDLPQLFPHFVIVLSSQAGRILSNSAEKLMIMQNTVNQAYSQTLSLHAYELVFESSLLPRYSASAAVELFSAVINLILFALVHYLLRKKEVAHE